MDTKLPKYLVRPSDFMVWHLIEYEGKQLYQRPKLPDYMAHDHFTFENLTENYDFFPITEEQVPEYESKCNDYYGFVSWQCRPDGHGGSKGGTREEYDAYLERVKAYSKNKFKQK